MIWRKIRGRGGKREGAGPQTAVQGGWSARKCEEGFLGWDTAGEETLHSVCVFVCVQSASILQTDKFNTLSFSLVFFPTARTGYKIYHLEISKNMIIFPCQNQKESEKKLASRQVRHQIRWKHQEGGLLRCFYGQINWPMQIHSSCNKAPIQWATQSAKPAPLVPRVLKRAEII